MFKETEQIPKYEKYYSYFLNELIKVRKDKKMSMDLLARMFNCSKGTISNFENRVKDYDFVMLFNYAGVFQYKITMFLDKKNYAEIIK